MTRVATVIVVLLASMASAGEISDLYRKQPHPSAAELKVPQNFADLEPPNTDITEIGLERGPCFGQCPAYTVFVKSDGTFRYRGEEYVPRKGSFTGEVNRTEFLRLAQFISDVGYLNLKDNYSVAATDLPTTFSTVVKRGERKVIRNYGNAGPSQLWAVECLIDGLLDSAHWDHPPASLHPPSHRPSKDSPSD